MLIYTGVEKILNKLIILSKAGLLIVSFVMPTLAQDNQPAESYSGEQIQQAPKVIEQPAYEYYYWPEEDLNNFGLSTIGNGKSGSTLGDKSKRTSNIEANEYLENRRKEKESEPEPNGTEKTPTEGNIAEPNNEVEFSSANPPSGKPLYEWRDENGTLHITNELGEVPPEYQEQLYKSNSQD